MVTRWITIGSFRRCSVMIRNCGVPNGYSMDWAGRVECFQPTEFIHWEHVLWAVKRRLEIAGLRLLTILKEPPRAGWFALRVLVKRTERSALRRYRRIRL